MISNKYQVAIYDAVQSPAVEFQNVCVQATAGAGKTTTLLEILKIVPKFKKKIFLSFSNTIVNELKSRIPIDTEASTIHSLGCRMIMRKYGRMKIDNDKWFKIMVNTFKKDELDKKVFKKCYEMADIINYARMTLTKFNVDSLAEMCDYYSIEYTGDHLERVIDEFTKERRLTSIDFTDMIYLPVRLNLIDLEFDYVLLDEAQDLNKSQKVLVEKILKPEGRLIAVGDKNQSIYSFSGSNIDSFDQLQGRPNTVTLPLSISYRCAKNIVLKAQEIYPDAIEAAENADTGEFRDGELSEIQEGDLVICRKTVPLVTVFFDLIERGIKASIIGKDIEQGLVNLAEKVQAGSEEKFEMNIATEVDKLIEELTKKGIRKIENQPQYIALEEKISVLRVIMKCIHKPEDLVATIRRIFDEKRGGVRLMTIHRSKGLENDRVFMIAKFEGKKLYPSDRATKDWELVQEANLQFVAITRAKKSMILLSVK